MIYEELNHVTRAWHEVRLGEGKYCLTLVNRSMHGIRILGTCRLVHDESSSILGAQLQRLRDQPPRMIIDVEHVLGLVSMHDKFGFESDLISLIMRTVDSKLALDAIHAYRKGEMSVEDLSSSIGLKKLLQENKSEVSSDKPEPEVVKAVTSFVLHAAKYKESRPQTPFR